MLCVYLLLLYFEQITVDIKMDIEWNKTLWRLKTNHFVFVSNKILSGNEWIVTKKKEKTIIIIIITVLI